MLRAHGLDPGPTERPLLTGLTAGAIGGMPGAAVLAAFGSLSHLAGTLDADAAGAAAAYVAFGALAGLLYALVFRRGANDRRGGWMFGMAFGFVVWMLGPVPLLQWLPETPTVVGFPAVGLFIGQLIWGLATGVAFPFVHKRVGAGVRPSEHRPADRRISLGVGRAHSMRFWSRGRPAYARADGGAARPLRTPSRDARAPRA
jgi:hypothetical protein